MDAETLKARQAPLKDQYRRDPASAMVTLRATGEAHGMACSIATGKALVEAGLHTATGGDGSQVCSGDMLLEALVACAGVTLRAVATSMGIPLADTTLTAEGDLDFRGTLGVAKEVPVGFQAIRLHIALGPEVPADQRAALLERTQRYCVVLQTLRAGCPVSVAA